MNQQVLPNGGYTNRSGNGMQRTSQTKKAQGGRTQSASTRGRTSYPSANTAAADCSISEGGRRVSRWLYGGESSVGMDWMFDGGDEVYMTDSVYQQAVNDVKKAQAEAAQEAEQLEEEAAAAAEGEEGDAVSGGYSESSLEYMERLLENMKKSREANSKKNASKKRALNYSYNRVSGAIMRAKSSRQAGSALSSAKSNLSALRMKSGSKMYDSKELEIAISHAKKMVRAAQKKVQNIRAEERRKKSDKDLENTHETKHSIIRRQQRGGAAAENAKIEREMLRLKKMLKNNREQRKNAHRRDENNDLLMADVEYIKRKLTLMRQEQMAQQTQTADTGASVGTEGLASAGTAGEASAGTSTEGGQSAGTTAAGTGAGNVASSGFEATV